jgi:hypothetical protein
MVLILMACLWEFAASHDPVFVSPRLSKNSACCPRSLWAIHWEQLFAFRTGLLHGRIAIRRCLTGIWDRWPSNPASSVEELEVPCSPPFVYTWMLALHVRVETRHVHAERHLAKAGVARRKGGVSPPERSGGGQRPVCTSEARKIGDAPCRRAIGAEPERT